MGYVFLSVLVYLLQNYSNKRFSQRHPGVPVFQNVMCVLFAAAVLGIAGYAKALPLSCLLLAAGYGALYLATIFSLLRAVTLGTLGMSTIVCNCGNLVATGYGILFRQDDCSGFTLVGMGCMVLVLVLSAPMEKEKKSVQRSWFLYALLSAGGNGLLGILKQTVTAEYTQVQSGTFLFWSFLFAGVCGMILLLCKKENRQKAAACLQKPLFPLACGLGAGAGTAGGNLFMMLALEAGVSSAIVFPLNSGLQSLLLWLMSYWVFREVRFTAKNAGALLFCILGVTMMNL